MPECDECGAHVTEQYARVFAGNDGIVWACRNCSDSTEVFRGAAAGL